MNHGNPRDYAVPVDPAGRVTRRTVLKAGGGLAAAGLAVPALGTDLAPARAGGAQATPVAGSPSALLAADLPAPWASRDIGDVGVAGTAVYSAADRTFTVQGAGDDIWGTADAFHFAYQPLRGDGQIVARVASVDAAEENAKAGVMIREGLDPDARHALMAVTTGNGSELLHRPETGGESQATGNDEIAAPYWVKLAREGDYLIGFESSDGQAWTQVGEQVLTLPEDVLVGLVVTSHDRQALGSALFDSVAVGAVELPEELTVRAVTLSEPTGLYVLETDSTVTPEVRIAVKSRYVADARGHVRLAVLSRGTTTVWEGTAPFDLRAGEQTQVVLPTTALDAADYYVLAVEILDRDGAVADARRLGFGVIRPAAEGLRYDSPFGMGLRSEGDPDVQKEIARRLGVKWTRGIHAVDPRIVHPEPGVFWGEEEITAARREIADWHAAGVHPLGYINYNMPWNVMPGPDGEQLDPYQNRPKDMAAHVEMVYSSIAPLHDLVKDWELWNEPWIHGWTWKTGEAQDYRDMTRLIWERVKPEFPDVNLIGSGSIQYSRDIVYARGAKDIGYLDGSASHAYGPPDPAQLAVTKLQKIMDEAYSKGGARAGLWQTELGTNEGMFEDLPEAERAYQVARSVAPTYLLQMLAAGETPIRVFWFSLAYGAEYSGDDFNIYDGETATPKPAVVAFAAMTHLLEDNRLLGEVYPDAKSTWGFLFERPDGKATAALYVDQGHHGRVTLDRARGLRVYDYLGRTIADGGQDLVTLALTPQEVYYLVSDRTPSELEGLLNDATFALARPLAVAPLSFTAPISDRTTIDIQVENTAPNLLAGELTVGAPSGWELVQPTVTLGELAPGERRTLRFPVARATANDINRYPVRYEVALADRAGRPAGTQAGEQTVQVVYAPHRTIQVDGSLDDWADVIPVTMVSAGSTDHLSAALNPDRAREILDAPGAFENVIYRAWTAWDDEHFYFATEVPDEEQVSNEPFSDDPYAFPFLVDSVQLAFDALEANPDDLLLGDRHYEKALAVEMDYLFVGTLAEGGLPELHRQAAPGTNYQTYYPTNGQLTPPLGTMDVTEQGGREGRIVVVREEAAKRTVYEFAIAWTALPTLGGDLARLAEGDAVEGRFAFAVNDAGETGHGKSYWAGEAGQVVSGSYGFAPFWGTGQQANGGRTITRWGFGRAAPGTPIRVDTTADGRP